MKLTTLAILLAPLFLFAQNSKKGKSNPDRLNPVEYDLTAEISAPELVHLPFSSIKVIDSRFDTTKIGYTQKGLALFKSPYKKITLKGGVALAIQNYYNDYYREAFDKSGFTLLIVLKKFWLSEMDYKIAQGFVRLDNKQTSWSAHCKWEYYLCKDEKYLPVKRVDTTWKMDPNLYEYINEHYEEKHFRFIKFTLKTLIEMLDFTKGLQAFDEQPKKTMQDIIAFNESRFNIPVLKAGNFSEGVYLDFEQFKSNKPSIIHFHEKQMKYGIINKENYIVDENENQINPYWGYYDGTTLKFGKFGNDKLYRCQNTFCFFVRVISFSVSQSPGVSQLGAPPIPSKTQGELHVPFQIDMETGEIY